MASIPWTSGTSTSIIATHKVLTTKSVSKLKTQFVNGKISRLGWVRSFGGVGIFGPTNGSRAKCWFKFGKNGVDAEGAGIYGSQSRDDFDRDDVEQVLSLSLS